MIWVLGQIAADLKDGNKKIINEKRNKLFNLISLNFILSVIILFTVSAYIIFMKYYEPMFIILLFLLFKTNLTKIFLNNKKIIYFYHLYFSMYLVTAIINSFLLLSKNI